MPILLIATLDTKGRELGFVRDRCRAAGFETIVIDGGSVGPPSIEPDIHREAVFARSGTPVQEIADRGQAVACAARGVASIAAELEGGGRVEGVFALGGSAGTTIGTAAMRALPFGLPKVMVSTLASGQTRPYVGGSDIVMVPSIVDVAGLNRLLRVVLANATDALIGMVQGSHRKSPSTAADREKPIIAATMFGVTTPCVEHARQRLEAAGCEVWVFHATGVGGQAMEALIRDGKVDAVLDLTTTELADEIVGGILSAGPDRLEAAGRKGIPQVVSVGALDMVNFGPKETVPERFAGRRFHVHNPTVTLMRTTPDENAAIGRHIAEALARAEGPTTLMLPLGGISGIDRPGQPFHDPEADSALFEALRTGLVGIPSVRVVEREEGINDPAFAEACAAESLRLIGRSMDASR